MNDSTKAKRPQVLLTGLFGIAAFLFAVCLVTVSLVLLSVIGDLAKPPSERVYDVTEKDVVPHTDYTRLHLNVVQLDEVRRAAKIRVNGFHSCTHECNAYEERILLYAADKKSTTLEEAVPSFEFVKMPPGSQEVTAEISLPVRGHLFAYPFDSYKLGIGIVLERKYPDGTVKKLTPEESKSQLFVTLEEEVESLELVKFAELDKKLLKPKKADFEYASAIQLNFKRPAYLVLVVMLILILSIVVTMYTMTSRPFNQLLINTSALIFGVWSIRSLLLKGYPVDITFLDTVLQTLVVFILLSLAFRGMNHFHRTNHLRLLPWARIPTHRACPECFSDVSPAAKRCPNCTSTLTPII